MPYCNKQVMTTGLNFNRLRQCKNHAIEGSKLCHAHQPKPKPEYKPDPYKTALFVAGLQAKARTRRGRAPKNPWET
jgi:hypothetical protein